MFYSCTSNDIENNNFQEIIVASEQRSCQGFITQTCFLIKENENDLWQLFYDQIKGFTYEEGFEYKLLVSKEQLYQVPEDASSIKTTLVEIISKEKKDSDNLPE